MLTPGAPARIEVTTTTVAGGHAMIVTERVDSARATVSVSSCTQSVVGGSCEPIAQSERVLSQPELDTLFGLVSSAGFRSVRSSYERAGDIIPPDPMQVRLEVTVRERTRTITWDRDAVIPPVLNRLRCLVTTATGSLILCAERP